MIQYWLIFNFNIKKIFILGENILGFVKHLSICIFIPNSLSFLAMRYGTKYWPS